MRKTGIAVITSYCVITLLLVLLGVVMVLSASQYKTRSDELNVYADMGKQLMALSIGLGGLGFFALYDYNQWARKSRYLLVFTIVLLAMVISPMGYEANGAQRWIRFAGFSFQPSDLMKFSVILYLSAVWAERKDDLASLSFGVIFPMLFVGIGLALILLEPDHGTTAFIGLLALVIWYAAGGRLLHLAPVMVAGAAVIAYALYTKPHLYERIHAFLRPELYPDKAYQVTQALNSFALGGLWGVGLGDGMQQLGFVPEIRTDFIFSVMGEELGFVKCAAVLSLYLALAVLGYWTAMRCTNPFGKLLAVGCTTAIGFQAAMNVAVVTGALPNKGISLPFISSGGTSLIIFMTMIGLMISVARDAFMVDRHGGGI